MYPGYYHTGYNPLTRNYRSRFGAYDVTFMCEGAWSYLMDDFGNAVEIPYDSYVASELFIAVGI